MNLRCKDCKVTFDSPYNKDCPFCGTDAFVVELLHENKETEPDYWMIRGEIWSDDIAFLEAHNGTSSEVQAAIDEWENYAVPLYKSPVTTDKLSVEKLQEIRVEELKDFNSKILQAELKNQKLQEQLNTAKYFFKNILDVKPSLKKGSYAHLSNCVNVMRNSAEKALAAIGGDDD
ncbi:hypothetical protein [Lactococcus lactis]|uniref:hypothetical protein n=1 Tax=Lactococcus lactis TaxID=1358 RepID=UPI0024171216|nr:hypothetical protein [Lactococcus lactis]MDG4957948.1 hypothetical protein [Lactococcus lactis]